MASRARPWSMPLLLIAVTLVSAWLTATRLSISSDLSALFPDRAASFALSRFVHAFGGGDVAAVLVRGRSAGEVEAAAHDLAELLAARPSITQVLERAPLPDSADGSIDPTLAWRFAGPTARAALAHALTPEGMRERLDGTRDMILAPGSAAAETWLARDPLRLALLPWEGRGELAAGVAPNAEGAFVADEGRARLVVLSPRGSAFDLEASKALVHDVAEVFAAVERDHPTVTARLTGGHAIAQSTEALLIRDLAVSGTLSLVLASVMFFLTFRHGRALAAVIPPLLVGTLWTTGFAALLPGGLSAIAIAFAAVVVGVGVDTGVHVYAALLDGRRRGLRPSEAKRFARARTRRPTLIAAVAAGLAFASLALSELSALRQLGILCGVGEVLTAIAILVLTPELGAWLERGAPPSAPSPRWLGAVEASTRNPARARVALGLACVPVLALMVVGWPQAASAIVAMRPSALEPLATQEEIFRLFGGRPGQWLVLSEDTDLEAASERADAVAEALEGLVQDETIDGFDALAPYAPADATQRARLAERDALDLPARRDALTGALVDYGFDLQTCAPALDAFSHPSHDVAPVGGASQGALSWIRARHLARDGDRAIAVTYVRPRGDEEVDARALRAIRAADPRAIVTGYPYLEAELKLSLVRDLPRVAVIALVLVAVALRGVLGRGRDVALALLAIVAEVACVALAMRLFHVGWHVYDALVLPVLVGVTIDESTFLLTAARERAKTADPVVAALRAQGPLVASTALTTSAGFAALLACRFEGLRDLGAVGTLGALLGLGAALIVVPAGLRLTMVHE